MNQSGIFRRRHLPHWDVEGHPVFITACLEGSMSAAGLKRIREYRTELEAEMYRIIDYIERNPVKAGLVERPEDWPWSSAKFRLLTDTRPGAPILKVG